MHRRLLAPILLGAAALAACGADGGGPTAGEAVDGDLTVFAAASLTDAFGAIGTAFTVANPDVDVTFSFGGSSGLVQQINEGAPADVFASADEANMTKLTGAGSAAGDPEPIATNTMEIAVEPANPKGVTGLADLGEVSLVVCAPEVPCGRLAAEILAAAGVAATPVSYEENVRAVLTKVELGEVDAGIVFATDVAAAGDAVQGVPIPPDQNAVTTLLAAVTAGAPNPVAAAAFVDFVTGSEGQAILASYGFGPR